MTTPDLLDTWSIRIAERAAPGESGFAAQTARAYAAGGAPRRNLFAAPGQAPGGMGGGAVAVLPAVLDGLAYAAESLKSALGSPELNNLLSATGLLVGLRAQRHAEAADRRPGEDGTAVPDVPGADVLPGGADAGSVVPPDGADAGSTVPTADVVRAALRMSARLRARGLAPDEADALTTRLIARLVTEDDPVEAAAFLDALVGDEPPPSPRGPATRCRKLRRLRSAASGLLHRSGRSRATPHGPSAGPDGTDQE
ncbi:hypothetical protein AB0F46_37380 [Streptomyces sp. NPDC026665]|uniref:hypothetical protein n=1 Tax=Streptomyces sp. NPDC026665 TaxID=3154798 RepID=UPI0033C1B982